MPHPLHHPTVDDNNEIIVDLELIAPTYDLPEVEIDEIDNWEIERRRHQGGKATTKELEVVEVSKFLAQCL